MRRLSPNAAAALGLVAALLLVVKAASAQQRNAPVRTMRITQDLSYYSGPDADPKYHNFDLYMPEGKTNVPVLFFIHGGGWKFGDKVYPGLDHIVNICYDLGMGVMSVNYRLNQKHPAHMEDLARAFKYLYDNAARLGADRNTIFVAGGSAGAHLAALLGADPRYLEREGLSLKNIKGVLAFSGVYDMPNWYTLQGASGAIASRTAGERNSSLGVLYPMVQDAFGTDYQQLLAAGAASYIGKSPGVPPYLISFTDDDMFGMSEQAISFYSLFVEHHLPARLVEQPGRIHETKTSGIGGKLEGADDVLGAAIRQFLSAVMNGSFGQELAAVYPPAGAKEPAMRVLKDLRYDESSGSDPKLNALDLYLPEGKENVPLVVYVHGGGWRVGDKANPTTLVNLFGRMGMGLASVNYRLSPQVKHPAQVQDVADAFAWLYKNAAQYKIDRNRVALVGASAGGHLVSLLALNPEYLSQAGAPMEAIKGVASISGVYDLNSWAEPGKIPSRKEMAFGLDANALRQASPITFVNAKAPPFLLTFTNWDLFMIRENTLEMYDAMLKAGARVELDMIPGRNHMGVNEIGKNVNQVDDVLGPALARFVEESVRLPQTRTYAAGGRP